MPKKKVNVKPKQNKILQNETKNSESKELKKGQKVLQNQQDEEILSDENELQPRIDEDLESPDETEGTEEDEDEEEETEDEEEEEIDMITKKIKTNSKTEFKVNKRPAKPKEPKWNWSRLKNKRYN